VVVVEDTSKPALSLTAADDSDDDDNNNNDDDDRKDNKHPTEEHP
jgi:hypothetical protein